MQGYPSQIGKNRRLETLPFLIEDGLQAAIRFGLGNTVEAQDSGGGSGAPAKALLQRGQHGAAEHRVQFPERPRHQDDDGSVFERDPLAGGGPAGVIQHRRAVDDPGLALIVGWDAHLEAAVPLLDPLPKFRLVPQAPPQRGGDPLARDVVEGRAESAANQNDVGPRNRRGHRVPDLPLIVDHRGFPFRRDARRTEREGEVGGVRVHLAGKQFASDAKNFRARAPWEGHAITGRISRDFRSQRRPRRVCVRRGSPRSVPQTSRGCPGAPTAAASDAPAMR